MALTFKLRGEQIIAMDPPVSGYAHRDIESLINGRPVEQALAVAERSCALAGHTHRTALCMALEASSGSVPSPRAQLLRSLFAEIERIQARLWLLAMMARAAGLTSLMRDALEQRELLYDALVEVTDARQYWGIAEVGGASLPGDVQWEPLIGALDAIGVGVGAWRVATGPRGPLGRAGASAGRITGDLARELELSGVAGRASGITRDLRRIAPYAGYALIDFDWGDDVTAAPTGDAAARADGAVQDLATSEQLARALLEALPGASDDAVVTSAARRSTSASQITVEGPHGVVAVAAQLGSNASVQGFILATPGARLFDALPTLLEGQTVAVAPLIIASLDLCVECLDH